jgi:hypothetical protein
MGVDIWKEHIAFIFKVEDRGFETIASYQTACSHNPEDHNINIITTNQLKTGIEASPEM